MNITKMVCLKKFNREDKMPGYIHLYTGNGKGKTTASLGLALRAAGAGKRIFIGQFIKGIKARKGIEF